MQTVIEQIPVENSTAKEAECNSRKTLHYSH